MLASLFPKSAHRYLSLPLFGPVVDDFDDWLLEQGYTRGSRRHCLFPTVVRMDQHLRRCGIERIKDLTPLTLQRCWKALQRHRPPAAGTVHVVERFLRVRGFLKSPLPNDSNPTSLQLAAYCEYLREVRGFAPSTVHQHLHTAREFLAYREFDKDSKALATVNAGDLEGFVRKASRGVSRGTLQHTVAELRGFLRFLAVCGKAAPGLETQIDTPRLYRQEQLPRALPWDTVRAFLQSIPRTTPMGRRDYAMFFLIATYGLRASEVVALTLDDLHWRSTRIRIPQTKVRSAIDLPLTDEVASVLVDYLRHVQRPAGFRQLFLRVRAPIGTLKPTAVTEAFQGWSRRSGLKIPFQGVHCLRHSYAVFLLRRGTSLKTIGDLLGHRSPESTAVYLRLATEDLREVGLSVPQPTCQTEVRS
jgi:integrase/recombinase XerD